MEPWNDATAVVVVTVGEGITSLNVLKGDLIIKPNEIKIVEMMLLG